nr:MAG TPA_asm: Repressor protein CI [Caudoviricetes sp.]
MRENQGLTADQVGTMIGRSGKAVNAWENGRGQPDIEMLMLLCKIYKVENILKEFQEYPESEKIEQISNISGRRNLPQNVIMDIGSLIRCRRLELGMTQEELGKMIGVQKQAVCKYENSRIDLKRDMIQKLAAALEIPPSYLLGTHGDDGAEIKNYDIGQRIRSLRESAGLSQKKFAQKLDISPGRLSNWELGINRPNADMIKTICKELGISANDLLGLPAAPKPTPSKEEMEMLGKYRILDVHGREMVDFVLEKEAERCEGV